MRATDECPRPRRVAPNARRRQVPAVASGSDPSGPPPGAAGHPYAIAAPPPGTPGPPTPNTPPPEPVPEPDHPLLKPVSDWLQLVSRAMRATRFYPPASATRVQQMEAAAQALPRLFEGEASFALRVKQDRLMLGKKPALVDDDRVNGLPYLLFSHSIFEVRFTQGVTAAELKSFLEAVVTDFAGEEHKGEDLTTLLWRLDLEHVEHQHLDVLAAAFNAQGDELGALEDPEVRRIRQELEAMMSALATNRSDGGDFRVMFDRALESPESAQAAELWEEQAAAWAMGALEATLPSGAFSGFRGEILDQDKPQFASLRLLERLLQDPIQNLGVLSKLVEGTLKSHDFESSLLIMERLHGTAGVGGEQIRELVHVLLDRLGSEEQVSHAVEALVKSENEEERARILSYLRMVGPAAANSILRVLDGVDVPALLDALADVVADAAAREPEIVEDLSGLSGRSVSALLRASNALPPSQRSALIWAASSHGEAEVRLSVLDILPGFGPGHADTIVVNALRDSDPLVRERAIAMSGEREIAAALPSLSRLIRAREQEDFSPGLLRVLLMAYAKVGRSKVVSDLVRILNHNPKLTDLRRGAQTQHDAALALAAIDDDVAREHLKKGAKSLNPTLRSACKDALASVSRFGMTGPTHALPLLGPRVETTLPTGVAAPARSSAPPPPMSVPVSRPPHPKPAASRPPGPTAAPAKSMRKSGPPGFDFHSVSAEHRTEALPPVSRRAPLPSPVAELPLDALIPIEAEPAAPPQPERRSSIPPPAPPAPASPKAPLDLHDQLFAFLEGDDEK